ncbi:MAG: hydroxymethylbilane synthase [Rickettsiales bacterium]|nr:hydroxymethylbilane synthase [Rickettsiales bacterium]
MLTIATRKSKLALIQSEMIKAALMQVGATDVDLLPLMTTGDADKERELLAIGGKGLFTKEIEQALLNGNAQIAMHSLKDMPVTMPEGLMIAGVLPRANPTDLLISHQPLTSLDDLPQGATIGTSSPRRAAQLLVLRPDLTIVNFRGNVPSRLVKVERGEVDATILAAAGLERLSITPQHSLALDVLPAIGQGIIALQCRSDDTETRQWIKKINHLPSWQQTLAERAVLKAVEGDCHTPLAAHATLSGDSLSITAQILSADGKTHYKAAQTGAIAQAAQLGEACGSVLLPKAEELWQRCS